MKRFLLWCAAALLPLLAACSFSLIPKSEFTETKTFDLAPPEPLTELPFLVNVESFSSECSGRYKMVFREDASRIGVDEYNRWVMPPGAMLTKYLAVCFAADSGNQEHAGKPVFVLDGSVLNWELDKTKKQVDMVVRYFIVEPGNSSFRITGYIKTILLGPTRPILRCVTNKATWSIAITAIRNSIRNKIQLV